MKACAVGYLKRKTHAINEGRFMKTEQLFSQEKNEIQEVVLVSVMEKGADKHEMEASFDELERLAETAGAKVFAQDQTTTDTSISLPKGLRANTEYYVRIKPVNETRECAYKYFRFKTEKADPTTVIIIQ
jgi:hypothetical protein